MKLLGIFLWIWSSFFRPHGEQTDVVINFQIAVTDSISNGKKESFIKLSFHNNSDRIVQLSDPRCWLNTQPKLIKDGVELPLKMAIKVNPRCLNRYETIKPNSNMELFFLFTFEEMYSKKLGSFYMEYSGLIKDENGIKITSEKSTIVSNSIRF